MKFLNNLFGSGAVDAESVKSFFINDMERKWKMHVEKTLQSNSENVASYLYAVQGMKFRGAPHHMPEAQTISQTSMAYGLVPKIQNNELNIQLTKFLEVYIYFYKNGTVGFLSNIVDNNDEELLYTFETSLNNAKSQYKSFIEDTHRKTFL